MSEKKKFIWKDINFKGFVQYLFTPKDPSSLAFLRILFGILMMMDLPDERGGSVIDLRWGDEKICHFPLFSFLKPVSYPYMSLLYGSMWIGTLGIATGTAFRLSCLMFTLPYWYILLLDKSFWNNHSYLFGLISIIFTFSSANNYWSVDGYFKQRKKYVPNWNYFLIKFQFFVLYFIAGLKKSDMEWLEGYSMRNLGQHWVFEPFKLFLTVEQIDQIIVHWCGFFLDLTIGFWLIIDKTRPLAMIFCASFHLMNSRLFSIGMFPYVCLAALPIYCSDDWPKKFLNYLTVSIEDLLEKYWPDSDSSQTEIIKEINNFSNVSNAESTEEVIKLNWKHKFLTLLILSHCGLQVFLPYSHFITKGYNNWTNGLYGYSWDMMIHSWETVMVVIKVKDNASGQVHFLDPEAWIWTDRWDKHADMCVQHAECIKRNLIDDLHNKDSSEAVTVISCENISIYIDVWCSLNHRSIQRMFNPHYDLLKAKWSPFETAEWLLPVITEYSDFRTKMDEISNWVHSWSNISDVLFVADFPGMCLENYISGQFSNISLSVIEGEVIFEYEEIPNVQSREIVLRENQRIDVESNDIHNVHTIGKKPSLYMYTYNKIIGRDFGFKEKSDNAVKGCSYSPFPLIEDIPKKIASFKQMLDHITNSFMHLMFNTTVYIRKRN